MKCENCGNHREGEGELCGTCLRELRVSPEAVVEGRSVIAPGRGLGRVLSEGVGADDPVEGAA